MGAAPTSLLGLVVAACLYQEPFVIHAIRRWCVGPALILVSMPILALPALGRTPTPQAS